MNGHPTLGGNSGSGSGAQATTPNLVLGPVPPFDFPFWFDADDADGTANSTIANLGAVATWYNKGRLTNAGVAVNLNKQAGNVILNKGKYSGRFGNLSTVQSDGTGWMATNNNAVIPALPAVCTIHLAFIMNDLTTAGGHKGILDGVGATRGGLDIESPAGEINFIGGGGGLVDALQNIHMLEFNILSMVYNGAASFSVLNGVKGPNVNPAPVGLTGLTVFSLLGGVFISAMEIGTLAFQNDATTYLTVQNWLRAKYGKCPQ